jgi:hypothetical protein
MERSGILDNDAGKSTTPDSVAVHPGYLLQQMIENVGQEYGGDTV